MNLTQNKFFIASILMVGFSGMAKVGPPPPPAGPPTPPGFPIDGSLLLLIVLGIVFSFIFLKKYSTTIKKA